MRFLIYLLTVCSIRASEPESDTEATEIDEDYLIVPVVNSPVEVFSTSVSSPLGVSSSSVASSYFAPFVPGIKGFVNPVNYLCYLNAILQLLIHADDRLNEYMLAHPTLEIPAGASDDAHSGGQIWSLVTQIFANHEMATPTHNSAKDLQNFLWMVAGANTKFADGVMEDANEALQYLFGYISTALVAAGERDEISDLFGIDLIHRTRCGIATCEHVQTSREKVLEFQVAVPKVSWVSFADLLPAYLAQEWIDETLCQKCNVRGRSARRGRIDKLPPLLMMSLLRFDSDGEKIYTNVEIMETLSFGETGGIFELVGIVHHDGTSSAGHYFTDFIQDGQWYRASDETVLPGFPILGGHTPYILLYKRITAVLTKRKDIEHTKDDAEEKVPRADEQDFSQVGRKDVRQDSQTDSRHGFRPIQTDGLTLSDMNAYLASLRDVDQDDDYEEQLARAIAASLGEA